MAEVMVIVGCLFQRIIFPNVPYQKPKSFGTYKLEKTDTNNELMVNIDVNGNEETSAENFAFNKNTWTAEIKNLNEDLFGNYTVTCCDNKKFNYVVVAKEAKIHLRELGVKEYRQGGRVMLSCGKFMHFGWPRVRVKWKFDCEDIPNAEYTYNETTGNIVMPQPKVCIGFKHFYEDINNRCKYYQCRGDKAFHRDCHDGHKWDIQGEICIALGVGETCDPVDLSDIEDDEERIEEESNRRRKREQNSRNITIARLSRPKPDSQPDPLCTGQAFHSDDNNDCRYYKCDSVGKSWHQTCAPHTKWWAGIQECVEIDGREKECNKSTYCTGDEEFYENINDKCTYLKCNNVSELDVTLCPPGARWNQSHLACELMDMKESCRQTLHCSSVGTYYISIHSKCDYYECTGPVEMFLRHCDKGKKWDQESNTCVTLFPYESCDPLEKAKKDREGVTCSVEYSSLEWCAKPHQLVIESECAGDSTPPSVDDDEKLKLPETEEKEKAKISKEKEKIDTSSADEQPLIRYARYCTLLCICLLCILLL